MNKIGIGFLLSLSLLASIDSWAQIWDSSFKANVTQPGELRSLAQQADGKIIVLGDFDRVGVEPVPGLARLNADGSLDRSFRAPEALAVDTQKLFVQADGRVILGGRYPSGRIDPISGYEILEAFRRLNSDGTLDTGFKPPLQVGPGGYVAAMVPDSGNSSLALTHYSSFHGGLLNLSMNLIRVNGDSGTFDQLTPFYDGSLRALGRLPDGSAIVGGEFLKVLDRVSGAFVNRRYLARIRSDGSLLNTFQPRIDGSFFTSVDHVAVTSNGRFLIGGSFDRVNDVPRPGLARLYAEGGVDLTFAPNGPVQPQPITSLLSLSDGRVLVGGYFSDTDSYRLVRLNADGSDDATWVFPKTYRSRFGVLAASGDNTLAGGFITLNQGGGAALLKLGANGAVDGTFQARMERPGGVQTLAGQSDGKIVIGGAFTSVDGLPRTNLARLNANGTLDTSFSVNAVRGGVTIVRALPDDRLFVGGHFVSIGNSQRRGLARLQKDGVVDNAFNPPLAAGATVLDLAPTSQGGAVVCGDFSTTGAVVRGLVARFETNGTVDASFTLPAVSSPNFGDPGLRSVDTLPDGRVLIGGSFRMVGGLSRHCVARLQANGSVDSSFDAGEFSDSFLIVPIVHGVRAGPEGRMFLAGSFNTIHGQFRYRSAGLDSQGGLLPGFSGGFRGVSMNTLSVSYNGYMAVAEGYGEGVQSFDPTGAHRFVTGSAPGPARATLAYPNGDVLIAGEFKVPGVGAGIVRAVLPSTDPPLITETPRPQTVEVGQTARFKVEASSPLPLSYRWFRNEVELPGETSDTLLLPAVTRDQAGLFRVRVRHEHAEVASEEARLVVLGGMQLDWRAAGNPGSWLLTGRSPDGGQFSAEELGHYAVESSSNLGQWSVLPGVFERVQEGTAVFSEAISGGGPPQFFRVRRR